MKKVLIFIGFGFPFLGFSQEEIKKEENPIEETLLQEEKSEFKGGFFSDPIAKSWELESPYKRGTFRLVQYQPNYFLFGRYASHPVEQPIGLNESRGVPEAKDYQSIETKFQVSIKSKVVQGLFNNKGDLWVGFTQQAYWQVYNADLSRPFRETNYEPELMFVYPLNLSAGNFRMRMAGLSVNHQSNGKEAVLSRSWNRLILTTSYEWGKFLITHKLWKRFSERNEEDDNPEIEEYVGRTELGIVYAYKRRMLALSVRNNLNFNKNRGRAELTFIHPLSGYLRVILQASHGYGDSLVDYNYKQTNIGVGVMFLNF